MEKCALPVHNNNNDNNHNEGNTNTSALPAQGLGVFFENNLQTGQVKRSQKRFRKIKLMSTSGAGKIINILHEREPSATPSSLDPDCGLRAVVKRIMQHYDISMYIQ